jgi:hypothetical protein
MIFYVAKAFQLAGLVAVALALFAGFAHGDSRGAMTRELGGAALGVGLFWAGRTIESR